MNHIISHRIVVTALDRRLCHRLAIVFGSSRDAFKSPRFHRDVGRSCDVGGGRELSDVTQALLGSMRLAAPTASPSRNGTDLLKCTHSSFRS